MVSRAGDGSVILSQHRSEALRALFPKLASWFETSNEQARRQEIEAFLCQAKDISDLERRILWLQRDALFSHYCWPPDAPVAA